MKKIEKGEVEFKHLKEFVFKGDMVSVDKFFLRASDKLKEDIFKKICEYTYFFSFSTQDMFYRSGYIESEEKRRHLGVLKHFNFIKRLTLFSQSMMGSASEDYYRVLFKDAVKSGDVGYDVLKDVVNELATRFLVQKRFDEIEVLGSYCGFDLFKEKSNRVVIMNADENKNGNLSIKYIHLSEPVFLPGFSIIWNCADDQIMNFLNSKKIDLPTIDVADVFLNKCLDNLTLRESIYLSDITLANELIWTLDKYKKVYNFKTLDKNLELGCEKNKLKI